MGSSAAGGHVMIGRLAGDGFGHCLILADHRFWPCLFFGDRRLEARTARASFFGNESRF